jgi:hypothetical protein
MNKKTRPTGTKKGRKTAPRVKLPKLKQGTLREFGYSTQEGSQKRRATLKKASKKHGSAVVIRKLNALAILSKNRSPALSTKYRQDMKWVQGQKRKAA